MTALQLLPLRQLAVLVLRDVLGFHTSALADMFESTAESVTSALKRARASLEQRLPGGVDRLPAPTSGSPSEDAIVAAYESSDGWWHS